MTDFYDFLRDCGRNTNRRSVSQSPQFQVVIQAAVGPRHQMVLPAAHQCRVERQGFARPGHAHFQRHLFIQPAGETGYELQGDVLDSGYGPAAAFIGCV